MKQILKARFLTPLAQSPIGALLAVCMLGYLTTFLAAGAAAQGANADLAGTWKGELGEGAAKLHLVLTITKASNGEFSGELNSVDQGAKLPMDSITLKADVFRFEVKAVSGVYEGKLNSAGTEIAGNWTQGAVPPQLLKFARSTADSSAKEKSAQNVPEGPTEKPLSVFLDVVVPIAPTAFKADAKWHLVYELHLTNMDRWNYQITNVEAISGDSSARSLVKYTGAGLDAVMRRSGQPPSATEKSKLPPGTMGIVYMWATIDTPEAVPATIRQRLTVKVGTYPEEQTVETTPIAIGKEAVVISSPLRGDHWFAANGPSNTSGHRRALIPIDGHAAIAQRFAIDWVKLRDDGKTFQGDEKDNKSYLAYGNEAYAVADGVVTETKDGIPENVPGIDSRAVPITLETVGGNHVILDIGGGHFAFYAHLQPGSLHVKLGEKVRRGQVVGLVGNSGNSTEPHLHFHIENGSSPLGAEGLPYSLASFEVVGRGEGWKPADAKGAAEVHKSEIPMENEVVNFSGNR